MEKRKHNQIDPWDEQVYGTGNTMPPKSHRGIIALLLMLVIFLSGIVSALSFLNIRLFWELNAQNDRQDPAPMSFSELNPTVSPTVPSVPRLDNHSQQDISLKLNGSPKSPENIPQEGGLSLQEIYKRNIDSVVSVSCTSKAAAGSGTGVIFSEEGYIVTNYHVVENAETITIRLTDGRSFTALPVGADRVTDLAVLYVDAPDLISAEFGDSRSLRVGDAVAAIGDPLGSQLQGSMTNGIVSAVNRNVSVGGYSIEVIQTNAAMNPGNSGGPLINCYGQVIGINTMKAVSQSDKAFVEGVGFAIPSATVKDIVDQLLSQGYISGRPTLGLSGESISLFDQQYFRIPAGLYLTEVESGSDAAAQGIEPGDILISLNGIPVQSLADLDSVVFSHTIGDTLEAVTFRHGIYYTLTLTILEAAK